MKKDFKKVSLVVLLVICGFSSQGQIPNSGFENWKDSEPVEWDYGGRKTMDSYQGSYAAKVKPDSGGFETLPALLYTGFRLENDPNQFNAYVKTKVSPTDSVYIFLKMFEDNKIKNTKKWATEKDIKSYKKISINIETNKIDSFFIAFKSGCCAINGSANENMVLKVDKLSFDFSTGRIPRERSNELKLYPNPTHNSFVNISGLQPGESYSYKIMKIGGEVALSGQFKLGNAEREKTIDLKKLKRRGNIFLLSLKKSDKLIGNKSLILN